MVLQYRNHPSVILWGVRINESQDNDKLYTRTNKRAHRLDPKDRPGECAIMKKAVCLRMLLVQITTFRIQAATRALRKRRITSSQPDKPYLVTEYNGICIHKEL